ncbi:MAG: Holliday junction branch migration protein RuvA [Chloroflexi bacterium]|nr:Holliday junction branch migration protein RuvA [Chloroflexota bacterium]
MIATLRGEIAARGVDHVVLEVAGIGYKVFVPRQPETTRVLLHTHQVFREDGQFLFGFATAEELTLFELLIGVSGVGPRAALALLATARPADLAAAIAAGDATALARAPGVGKKTAERLIVDLRGKVGGLVRGGSPLLPDDEVAVALVALGFSPTEALTALRGIPPAGGSATTAERLAAALRGASGTV